jgi:hypothetical protein
MKKRTAFLIGFMALLVAALFYFDKATTLFAPDPSENPNAKTYNEEVAPKSQDRLKVCNLVSEPIVELGYKANGTLRQQRQCNFLCQDKTEITVHTETEYPCPATLYD